MSSLAAVHLIVLGLWGGVVAVEVLFELRGLQGRLAPEVVARMHAETDRYLELPLLALVVLTGTLLWRGADYAPALLPKVAFGLGAVAANLGNSVFVYYRFGGRIPSSQTPRYLVLTVLPGLAFAAAAFVVGGGRAGWW